MTIMMKSCHLELTEVIGFTVLVSLDCKMYKIVHCLLNSQVALFGMAVFSEKDVGISQVA